MFLVYSVVFFLFNRIARTDNIVGQSTHRFTSTSGQAGKLAEYAKVVIQSLTVKQTGEAKHVDQLYVKLISTMNSFDNVIVTNLFFVTFRVSHYQVFFEKVM
jgi:hypothetical protein